MFIFKKKEIILFIILSGQTLGLAYGQNNEIGFLRRSKQIIYHTAIFYQPPSVNIGDPEKYYWPKAIARLTQHGETDSLANAWIELFKDRSPFHFTLVGMARLMARHPNASALQLHRNAYLARVFARTDGHNAWTSEGTENHLNMARTSGYLYAQYALADPNLFPQAPARLSQMENWALAWAKRLYEVGPGEWNSSIYGAYNVIGWLNLYDFAESPTLRRVARAVLDFYATDLALHYSFGTLGGPEMRGQGAGRTGGTSAHFLAWLWFGGDQPADFTAGREYIQCIHAATSGYRPPNALIALADKRGTAPVEYRETRPDYLQQAQSFVNIAYFATPGFTLGSAQSQYGGWTGSTHQMVNWKLVVDRAQAGAPPNEWPKPLEMSGNGRFYDTQRGQATDPFTQIAQHKGTLIQLTQLPKNVDKVHQKVKVVVAQWQHDWLAGFTMRFPDDDKPQVVNLGSQPLLHNASYLHLSADLVLPQGVWADGPPYCLQLGSTYVALMPLGGSPAMVRPMEKTGLMVTDSAARGQLCGWIVDVVPASSVESYQFFIQSAKKAWQQARIWPHRGKVRYQSISGDEIIAHFRANGTFTEATVDWGYGPGQPQVMATATHAQPTPFRQPNWPTGQGFGRIASLNVNGKNRSYPRISPLMAGGILQVGEGMLKLKAGPQSYSVDFRQQYPVFSDDR